MDQYQLPHQSVYCWNYGKIQPYIDWAGKKSSLYGIIFLGIYISKQIWYGVGLYGLILHKVSLYGGGLPLLQASLPTPVSVLKAVT